MVCLFNFSGMHGKGHQMNDLLATTLYGAIICVETHFKNNTNIDTFIAGTQFNCTNKNRATHGGGMAIFHNTNLHFEELVIPTTRKIEVIAIKNNTTIICGVYWPPQAPRDRCEDLEKILNHLSQYANSHHIILAGDFNFPGIKWKTEYDIHPYLIPDIDDTRHIEREALLFLHHANMQQLISQPNNRGTFLDLIFSNRPDKCELTSTEQHQVTTPTVHHIPLAIEITEGSSTTDASSHRELHKIDHKKLSEALTSIPLSIEPSRRGIVRQLNLITSAIRNAIVTIRCKVRPYEANHPWLIGSAEYRNLRKSIQLATRRGDFDSAKKERKDMSKLYSKLKEEYCKNKLSPSGSPMDLFNFMRFAKNKQPLPQEMTLGGQPVTNIHEAFIKHLGSAFDDVEEPLYSDETPFNEKLRSIFDQNYIPNESVNDITGFTEEEILGAIKEIDKKKDPGMMKLPPTAFIAHAEEMAKVITPLLNACALTHWIPEEIMRTILVPIPKSGCKKKIENYRGIALSNILCKLIDKILTKKLTSIMEPGIDPAQYGFRTHRSTIGCVFDAAQFITEQMKWTGRVDAAFLDISKAFDRLSHTSIATSLCKIGIPYRQLLFVMTFINQRQYFVRVNGELSSDSIIPDSGISQGSHIGPALFVLVANQMKQHIHPTTKLYQ